MLMGKIEYGVSAINESAPKTSQIEYLPPFAKNLGRKSGRLGALDSFRAGEQAAVDSIDDGLGSNLSTAEEPSVQTLDGILATLNTVEFQIDVALRVRI